MTLTAEYRLLAPRATWMTARARNAMNRPIFIGAVSVGTFVTALVALVVMPQQAQRAALAAAPKPGELPDTIPLAQRVARATAALDAADSALSDARIKSALLAQTALDTLSPARMAYRDSLAGRVAELERLLARAETAPLTASYRALGESPELAGSGRVKILLDSLADIEREREAVGTSGGADPVFVALTSRATEIGHAIQAVAIQRHETMTAEITALAPPPRPSAVQLAGADTAAHIAQREAAQTELAAATNELDRARRIAVQIERRVARAREVATLSAPPYALLASAIVFGLVLGFGAALTQELRWPRIADAREAERVARVRVISTIRPRPPSPERGRRLADRLAPPHIDPGNDAHQLTWLFLAPPASALLMLTITGEEPAIAAIVAANLAGVAADEARNCIVIDTDARASAVASSLRMRARPGLDDILDGRASWPEATQHATIGRDRIIDVVASGTGMPTPDVTEISELLRRDAARLPRHYDTVLIVASEEQTLSGLPGVLPMNPVLYCARVGYTRLVELKRAIQGIRLAGGSPIGIVLWDDAPPALLTSEQLETDPQAARTAEMEALVAGRAR